MGWQLTVGGSIAESTSPGFGLRVSAELDGRLLPGLGEPFAPPERSPKTEDTANGPLRKCPAEPTKVGALTGRTVLAVDGELDGEEEENAPEVGSAPLVSRIARR